MGRVLLPHGTLLRPRVMFLPPCGSSSRALPVFVKTAGGLEPKLRSPRDWDATEPLGQVPQAREGAGPRPFMGGRGTVSPARVWGGEVAFSGVSRRPRDSACTRYVGAPASFISQVFSPRLAEPRCARPRSGVSRTHQVHSRQQALTVLLPSVSSCTADCVLRARHAPLMTAPARSLPILAGFRLPAAGGEQEIHRRTRQYFRHSQRRLTKGSQTRAKRVGKAFLVEGTAMGQDPQNL